MLLCFLYFLPRGGNWDENSRFDMSLAVANHGTVAIDPYIWNTKDIDYLGGHYYSIMAPGEALSGVPLVLATRGIAHLMGAGRAADAVGSKGHEKATLGYYVMLLFGDDLIGASLPAIFLVMLFFWFLGYFSTSVANRLLLSSFLGLGSMVFAYGQVFFSHVPAAASLFAAFLLIFMVANGKARGAKSAWLLAHPEIAMSLAGLALGLAELYEYPAAVLGLPIFVYACLCVRRRLVVYLLAGCIPGALGLAGYDWVIYHNPLMTGYSAHSVLWKGKLGQGIGGSTWPPKWNAIWGMTFSPYRGIFVLNPLLLLAIPGYWLWAKRRGREWALFLLIPLLYLLAIGMSPFWFAGSTVGPRYLIPAVPFLAFPIIFALDRVRSWWGRCLIWTLAATSALNVWAQTLGGGGYPLEKYRDPLFNYSIPQIMHSNVALSVGSLFLAPFSGLTSDVTLIPLVFLVGLWTAICLRPRRQRRVVGKAALKTQTELQR